jgi:hypothetical protein
LPYKFLSSSIESLMKGGKAKKLALNGLEIVMGGAVDTTRKALLDWI